MKKEIYPGTFDPITFGHIDLIKKSLNIFDKVIVAVSDGNTKNYLFNSEEREHLIKKALFTDLKFNKKKIMVMSFKIIKTDFCKKINANFIVRGIRNNGDFEFEKAIARTNRKLSKIETIFLLTSAKTSYISSSIVRELISNKGNYELLVPNCVRA